MKKNKRLERRKKAIFNIYNLVILGCCIIILGTVYIMFEPVKTITSDGMTVIETNVKKSEDIAEEQAREIAVKQFNEIDEKVEKEEVNIEKIERSGEEYYYITSQQNSLEIKIRGGTITRINTIPIEE